MIEHFSSKEPYDYGICYKCMSIFYKGILEQFNSRDKCPVCGNKKLVIEHKAPPRCVRDNSLVRFGGTLLKEIPKESDEYKWLLTYIITENDIQFYLKR